MVFDSLFGDSCSQVRSHSHDPLENYRLMSNAMRSIESHDTDTAPAKKATDYTSISESLMRTAVRFYDKNLDPAGLQLLLEGSDSGRNQLDQHGRKRGYDGIADSLHLARQNGASGSHIDKLEKCATMLGRSIFGSSYELPHKHRAR